MVSPSWSSATGPDSKRGERRVAGHGRVMLTCTGSAPQLRHHFGLSEIVGRPRATTMYQDLEQRLASLWGATVASKGFV